MISDLEAYKSFPHHRKWFNKLWFSEAMSYNCGPCGSPVTETGWYITRPVINLSGMSVGAEKKYLQKSDIINTPLGHFWCEFFHGEQYSITYKNVEGVWTPISCWRGVIEDHSHLSKFSRWERTGWLEIHKKLPDIFCELVDLEYINVEFIDGFPIEVHLRRSPDPEYDILIPIWKNEHFLVDKYEKMGYSVISSYDDADGHLDVPRIAFAVKNRKE